MKTVFLRVLEAGDKATTLLEAIREPERACGRQRFEVDPASFSMVPRSPFAYWVSDRLRHLFKELPAFEAEGRTAKQGLATADDFRFVRAWWAVPASPADARWFPIVKGGRFAPYYANVPTVVNWGCDGAEPKAWASSLYNQSHWSRILKNTDLFFRPGLTWPLRGVRFSAQAVPRGCVFSVAGKMAFAEVNELLWFLALFNARAFDKFIAFFAGKVGGVQYEVGLLQNVPVPRPPIESMVAVSAHARRAWSLKRSLNTSIEISRAFAIPALLQVEGTDLASRAASWSEHLYAVEAELTIIQLEIDARCIELYGIDEADRRSITEGFSGGDSEYQSSEEASEAEDDADEDGDESEAAGDAAGLAADLVSWAVGVAFGRFDIRLAIGEGGTPTEPEPFDPLPACSPGMLTGDDGLPLAAPPTEYPLAFPESGMLVDDLGHALDLPTAVRAVCEATFGGKSDQWWNDVAVLLDPKGHDLRTWLADSFFEHHLKRYSKSRRKAPILWQLGTPSGRYSVWLYAHRLTPDSFFQLQNEVVGPKLAHEERQLTSLIQSAGSNPAASERKGIAAQEAFVEELRTMLDEIKRLAPLWNPNLDDGVVLTMAPLWRLVPQYKSWQKELKNKWDELCAGKYDWAHVAMHLWPERVVPKCTTDRSLAIAHGLEDVFWAEDFNRRWRAIGSRNEERDHVARHWAASPLCKVIQMARELWEQRYRDSGQRDDSWWQDGEAGLHDDHPLALLVWPERVCRRAFYEPRIAAAHGFTIPKQTTGLDEDEDRVRCEWIQKMLIRHSAVPEAGSFLSSAFSSLADAETWKAWWECFDRGELDHCAVPRYLRSAAVSEKCQNNLELAIIHGVERFFFVDRGAGLSARLEPAEELSREVTGRTSPAVKAALSNLTNAPVVGTKSRDHSRTRARPAEIGGSR